MTREEAMSLITKYKDNDVADIRVIKQFIKQIYDDLQSRVCENCKHFTKCDDGYNYCDVYSRLNGFVDKDFGCNKFERKDVA